MKRRSITRMALGATALLGLVIAPVLMATAASAAPLWGGGTYTCSGGNVPAGTYQSIRVTGVCFMPAGTVVVRGDLTVAPGALLDAVTPGDPSASPVVPATVLIRGNVLVGKGAVLALGCSPNISCPSGISFDRVGGDVIALGSLAVVIHSATIGGNVTVLGGGGGAAGGANSAGCFNTAKFPIPAPWSEAPGLVAGGPQYTDVEDASIGGSLTIAGVQTCWLGSLRNQVRGSLTYAKNVTSDPDGMEINNNLMGGNMICLHNNPAVQYGDAAAAPNLVAGFALGQCGFKVVVPNTGPSEVPTSEHISASLRSLKTYFGRHTATFAASLPPVTTESGFTITAVINNFVLAGNGLRGSGTFNPKTPPGMSGDAVLSTVSRDGSSSFVAFDTCKCRFGGRTGTVLMRFYGTATPNGFAHGTFLVTSGGTVNGGLATLAGWGTFSSAGAAGRDLAPGRAPQDHLNLLGRTARYAGLAPRTVIRDVRDTANPGHPRPGPAGTPRPASASLQDRDPDHILGHGQIAGHHR